MAKLAVVTTEDTPPPLSGGRAELARATEQLSAAMRALEEAQKPEQRLSAVVAELSAIEGGLEKLRSVDAGALAEWLASGDGERPEPSAETLHCERRLINLRRDGTAAQSALPFAQEAVQRSVERVRDAGRAQEAALFRVALEALEAFCLRRLLPAINEMLALQAIANGLEQRLWVEGRRGEGSPAALSAAAAAAEVIARAKVAAGVPHNVASADRLLQQLASDPGAELGVE